MSELIIGGNFTTPPYAMFSAIAEAASHKYYMYKDKSNRIWLVGDEPNSAEHIYVDGGKCSNGFGGRTMTFELVDGSTVNLTGPWHTNSGALLQAVGIDLRDKYFTWGCIGTDRYFSNGNFGISNLIYIDKEPILGKYDRIDNLAKQLSEKRQECLFYYRQTLGGSTLGPVNYEKFPRRSGQNQENRRPEK